MNLVVVLLMLVLLRTSTSSGEVAARKTGPTIVNAFETERRKYCTVVLRKQQIRQWRAGALCVAGCVAMIGRCGGENRAPPGTKKQQAPGEEEERPLNRSATRQAVV